MHKSLKTRLYFKINKEVIKEYELKSNKNALIYMNYEFLVVI